MSALPFLLSRLLDTPLLASPSHAATVLGVLADQLGVSRIGLGTELLDPAELRAGARDVVRARPGYLVDRGLAIVPVVGSLVSRGSTISPQSGLTSYTSIDQALADAVADREVKGIVLDVDSTGGEAAGCLDLARRVRAAAAVKPVLAVLDEVGCSAAYALACGASRVVVPRSGQLGSIGVVVVHRDRSGQLEKEGVRITLVTAGARKADGNGFGPLPPEVAARVQASVADLYEQFVALVSDHRGLSPEAVRSTEGGVLLAPAAVELGLADAIMPAREAVAEFRASLAPSRSASTPTPTVPLAGDVLPAPAPGAGEGEEVPVTTAATTYPAAGAGAVDAIRREVAARFSAVLGLPDAQGPLAPLAQHLALSTSLDAGEVAAVLAVAKGCKGGGGHTDFVSAMARLGNPSVGADEGSGAEESMEDMLSSFRRLEGRG